MASTSNERSEVGIAQLESLDRRALIDIILEQREVIAEQRRVIAELRAMVAKLEARVTELETRLNQNSQNSSRPPSADPPSAPVRPSKPKSGLKPGGQPGHEGHYRKLVPVEKVAKLESVKPERCRKCGTRLEGEDPDPQRHQVLELPEVEPLVLEWQLHELECPCCGEKTRAELPAGVPRGGFGPRMVAAVALLSGCYRLSKRLIVHLLANLFRTPMSLGSVTACERLASQAVAQPVEEARCHVRDQAVKHADESSWFEGPQRAKVWLWTVTTQLVTVFLIRASRGKDVALEMLGRAFGVLVTDRWCAYVWWPLRWRQLCWAHIKRHFQAFEEAGGEAGCCVA